MFDRYIQSQIKSTKAKKNSQLLHRTIGLMVIVVIQIINKSFNRYTMILLTYVLIFVVNELEKIKIIETMKKNDE
ncbi:hypothetical protein [Helicovermis profundi]|uniref:Uncharacterized protein n=1 Tax=Helicovermis profundi TaxID=3065157 RepID=A0AAU9EW37_9FIRM|nr:hypothetical protein HLPR_16460 [Clostridia bacterium S502]